MRSDYDTICRMSSVWCTTVISPVPLHSPKLCHWNRCVTPPWDTGYRDPKLTVSCNHWWNNRGSRWRATIDPSIHSIHYLLLLPVLMLHFLFRQASWRWASRNQFTGSFISVDESLPKTASIPVLCAHSSPRRRTVDRWVLFWASQLRRAWSTSRHCWKSGMQKVCWYSWRELKKHLTSRRKYAEKSFRWDRNRANMKEIHPSCFLD